LPPTANEAQAGADSELTDSDISLLCDIGGSFHDASTAQKRAQLQRLIERGFVEPAGVDNAHAKYQLTTKAIEILTERGVGLNEA
jgi:hypothetical protein